MAEFSELLDDSDWISFFAFMVDWNGNSNCGNLGLLRPNATTIINAEHDTLQLSSSGNG